MIGPSLSILISILCLITNVTCYSQNLDLVEGFYEIIENESKNSRQMFLRGDSSQVYYISERPVVSKHDRKDVQVDKDTNTLYFFFDGQGTRKLLDYTTKHIGGKLGFVYVGSLNEIYTVEEIVDNGIIRFMSGRIYMVKPPSGLVK